jgi:tRNA threonylcarbamoyladenosine biosynthesis protein TsaB
VITLAIDAVTSIGTVAVFRDDTLVAEGEVAMRGSAEERLMPLVATALDDARVRAGALDRVLCGSGPGSFTSLRVAAAIAKGLVLGGRADLYAMSSLALMVATHRGAPARGESRHVAVLDALRGDWYVGVFASRATGGVVAHAPHALVPAGDLAVYVATHGGDLLGAVLADDDEARGAGGQDVVATPTARPHARAAMRLDPSLHVGPVDPASWEPEYGRLAEAQVKWEAMHGRRLAHG